jgi:hypothetical protein
LPLKTGEANERVLFQASYIIEGAAGKACRFHDTTTIRIMALVITLNTGDIAYNDNTYLVKGLKILGLGFSPTVCKLKSFL